MASITVRALDAQLKARLRVRAAEHGTSMEEEARDILRTALAEGKRHKRKLGHAIAARFAALGGVDLELPPREPRRAPPRLGR